MGWSPQALAIYCVMLLGVGWLFVHWASVIAEPEFSPGLIPIARPEKPRIKLARPTGRLSVWLCEGAGQRAFGWTPYEAFYLWLAGVEGRVISEGGTWK